MKKKILSTVSILLVISSVLSGCSKSTENDLPSTTTESVTYSETAGSTEATIETSTSETTEDTTITTTTTTTTTASKASQTTPTSTTSVTSTSTTSTTTTTKTTIPETTHTRVKTRIFTTKTKTTAKSTTASTTASTSSSTTKTTASTTKATTKSTTKATTKSVEKNFFDDAVFVGDSVTLGLRNYVTSERNKGKSCLGKAQFLTAGSMGYTNTVPAIGTAEAIHPKYQGKEIMIEDGIKKIGAKKVFIMLGMNDFCAFPLDTGMANAKKCIKRITDKNPGVKIYVESVTPTLNNKGRFNNTNINAFNDGLKKLCNENGWTYVDVASVMKDSNGLLKKSYCSDPEGRGVHMTYAGCAAWVSYLTKKFA